MKISTKVEYGIIALIDIAINIESNEFVTAVSIAERQGISKNYLEQILTPLRQAGIITGTKGSQGGYSLNKEPKDLKMSFVLNALDRNLLGISSENSNKYDQNMKLAINNMLWNKIDSAILKIAQDTTLNDLVEEYKKHNISGFMYYI